MSCSQRESGKKRSNPSSDHEEDRKYFSEEDESVGDGYDSDVEGPEYRAFQDGMRKEFDSDEKRNAHIEPGTEDSTYEDTKLNGYVKLTARGTTEVIGIVDLQKTTEKKPTLHNKKIIDVSIPSIPDEWSASKVQKERGEPEFLEVDNPGQWPRYCFCPSFENRKKDSKYVSHALPTEAIPVPKNTDGIRSVNGWTFHYQGYTNPDKPYRRGATTSNLFPKETKGCLDAGLLRMMGLNRARMKDPFFFYSLILPNCDPKKSGIKNDPRKPFYTLVENFTNVYKSQSGAGGSYGHSWKPTNAQELVHFDGILIRDGVLGGSKGALYRRWREKDCMYHEPISTTMSYTRAMELKRALKLNYNFGDSSRKDKPEYNPAHKFDLLMDVICHNVNAFTLKADEHLTIDEMTWGFGGYGEAGSGLSRRLKDKKVPKGGQIVIITDSSRCRPRAYIHRHKLHKYPEGFTREGCSEAHYLLSKILQMIKGDENHPAVKKIFEKKPTTTADNYFFDDKLANFIGENGLGYVATNARNFLPKDIPKKYLMVKKTLPRDKTAKVARFISPIVAVKNVKHSNGVSSQRLHCSFQSTSSCNISTVNALNDCNLFVELRERGRGENKRHWAIEMNDARRVYLSTYHMVDVIDHYIEIASIFYKSWKYWHAPKNQGLALANVVAYSFYLECAEGGLDPSWYIEEKERFDFHTFRQINSQRMMNYDPRNLTLPGDEFFRKCTKVNAKNQKKSRTDKNGLVSVDAFKQAKQSDDSRLCGDLDKLCHHFHSLKTCNNGRLCAYCGKRCFSICGLCDVPLHHNTREAHGGICFLKYHSDTHFGLARDDAYKVLGNSKKEWSPPNESDENLNRDHIKSISLRLEEQLEMEALYGNE